MGNETDRKENAMSVIDKFMSFMNVNDDEEGTEYTEYENDDYEEQDAAPAKDVLTEDNRIRSFAPRSNTKGKKMASGQDNASVCVFKPTNVSESREITQTLRENKTVVLNLEDADDMSAQRILDFTSGSCFALDGTLQKISNYIFIVTPKSVDISGDLQDTIAESFGV